MTPSKQSMFLQRLFHLHDVQTRRAGRACVTRLTPEQWVSQIDLICVQVYIYDHMIISKNNAGENEFPLDILQKVELGILEGYLAVKFLSSFQLLAAAASLATVLFGVHGHVRFAISRVKKLVFVSYSANILLRPRDFAEEAMDLLTTKDRNFKPADSTMWKDNASTPQESEAGPSQEVPLDAADNKLDALSKDAKQKAWQHDSLSLARDVAAIAKMMQQVQKTEKAERLRRITHVRSENVIGASIISNHMEKHAKHLGGSEADLTHAVEQAWTYATFENHSAKCVG